MFVKLLLEKTQFGKTKKKYTSGFKNILLYLFKKMKNKKINITTSSKSKNDLYSELYNVSLPKKIMDETANYHYIIYEKLLFDKGNVFDHFRKKMEVSLGKLVHDKLNNNKRILITVENFLNCQINIFH